MDKLYCKFDELAKLDRKFDELAKLDCKLDELAKLRMSSMSWMSCTVNRIYVQSNHFSHFCPEIIWSIEIHGDSCGLRTSYSVSRNLLSTINR